MESMESGESVNTLDKAGAISSFLGRKNRRDFQINPDQLTPLVQGRVLFDESLARYTTMRVGGPADALIFPSDHEDLCRVLTYADSEKIPLFLLGGGSNLLIRDGGIRGMVLCLREGFNEVHEITPREEHIAMVKELEGNDVDLEKRVFYRLQAGASLPRFVRNVGSLGYSGLEGLVGVVGSIGGALRMNAGTRHGEMGARVLSIDAINRAGQKRTFLRKKLRFDYRHLDLDKNWILLEAVVYLEKRPAQEVKAKIKEILDYRQKTQPLNLPNAGSIFKNPKEIAAGKVIEKLGLKGTRLRGAKVSELHGNWVVNLGNATAQDILQLIALIKDRVQEKEDLLLETEIQIFGERS